MFAVIAADKDPGPEDIAAMAAALPASAGTPSRIWREATGRCSMAFRHSPLTPEDTFNSQPTVELDLVFVCRARLDNRAELLSSLCIRRVYDVEVSDSDIVRHAYRKWGERTPSHLFGDFSFVAWERAANRVVAATDHLGTYPLFYRKRRGWLSLATQLSTLLAPSACRPDLDIRSVGLMAAAKLGHGWTMFQDVRVLEGGELLVYDGMSLHIRRWWQPEMLPGIRYSRALDYVEDIRTLFTSAVSARVRACEAIASTLSGGLDSTLVAATAARQLATKNATLDVYTAVPEPGLPTMSRPGWDTDDSPWARAVSRLHANMRHHFVAPGGITPLDILPVVHAVSLTPIRNTANLVWSWQISKQAAALGSRVILCGDHGNLSVSYPGDLCDADCIGMTRIAEAVQRLRDRVRLAGLGTVARRLLARRRPVSEQLEGSLRPGAEILLPEFRRAYIEELTRVQAAPSVRDIFSSAITAPARAARVDFVAQLGVEWRDPTTDRRLLERLLTYPLHAFRAGYRPRGLARELGRGLLPESVRLRYSRGAQSPDEAAWFPPRAEDYRQALQSIRRSAICVEFLDVRRLEKMLETLCAGKGSWMQATIVHRALDAGLFAAGYTSRTSHSLVGSSVR
jgi:asparagine synthase (glutamine-hydrolysing)